MIMICVDGYDLKHIQIIILCVLNVFINVIIILTFNSSLMYDDDHRSLFLKNRQSINNEENCAPHPYLQNVF